MAASSGVTKMFEEKVGEKEIYDFTLGNPEIETPAKFTEELKRLVNNPFPALGILDFFTFNILIY